MKNIRLSKLLFVFAAILAILVSCDNNNEDSKFPPAEENLKDTIPVIIEIEKEEPPYIVTYKLDSISDMAAWNSLYDQDQKSLIYAINRIEKVRVAAGSKLLVPDSLSADILLYSPFPKDLDLLDEIPKTVLIAQRIQAFGLYENGKLIKWGPISSGKFSTPTPNGLHYGNYKAKRKVSTVNSDWILPYYFNFMNFEGVGVHQYLLPGFPASHACVRLDMADAKFIYDWAQQWQLDPAGQVIEKNGTPFMVFGEYDFEAPSPPWTQLVSDPHSNFLNDEEKEKIAGYVEAYMKDPKNFSKNIKG